MTLTKGEAQRASLSKWHEIKAEFEETFSAINEPCGFCVYCIERTEPALHGQRCKLCRKEVPEVWRICKEMADFFSAKHGRLNKMIDAIIKTIREVKV